MNWCIQFIHSTTNRKVHGDHLLITILTISPMHFIFLLINLRFELHLNGLNFEKKPWTDLSIPNLGMKISLQLLRDQIIFLRRSLEVSLEDLELNALVVFVPGKSFLSNNPHLSSEWEERTSKKRDLDQLVKCLVSWPCPVLLAENQMVFFFMAHWEGQGMPGTKPQMSVIQH